MIIRWLFFLSSLFIGEILGNGRIQGVAVRGRFLCGQNPISHAIVKIIDKDPGKDPDDLLDETSTDSEGRFSLSGATREDGDIEAAIKVYHDCNDEKQPCQRKMIWNIPKAYNNNGTITQWFDIGEINLELGFKEEERDCRHKRKRHLRGHRKSNFRKN